VMIDEIEEAIVKSHLSAKEYIDRLYTNAVVTKAINMSVEIEENVISIDFTQNHIEMILQNHQIELEMKNDA